MDKSKTMEVLRNLKFMQRKEEANRRELFEANHRRQMEERLRASSALASSDGGRYNTATSSDGLAPNAGRKTATIFYDMNFPRKLYSNSRRSFTEKLPPSTPLALLSSSVVATTVDRTDGCPQGLGQTTTRNMSRDSAGAEQHSSDDGEHWRDLEEEDVTAVNYSDKGKRFCVKSNAPKLPRSLAEKVSGVKRRHQGSDED